MVQEPQIDKVVSALRVSVGLLVRRMRQAKGGGELSLSETSALARLDRDGPSTVTALARVEQISAQSMGATLAALEQRGLIGRGADPNDGRRIVLSVTAAGREFLRDGRNARTALLVHAIATAFTPAERVQLLAAAPLIERLAQSI
jgi:DNA-binding MarR family transcriptional regulator